MSHVFQPLRRALLGLAVLGLAACESSEAPVAPAPGGEASTATVHGVELVTVRPSARRLFVADGATAERVSARDGATITSDDATLTVVPGSIPDDTTIVMKPESNGFVSFRFGPNGLRFDPPATLTIRAAKANLSGVDPQDLAIAGAHDDADDWRVIGGVYDPVAHTVTVDLHHFSRYALCVR